MKHLEITFKKDIYHGMTLVTEKGQNGVVLSNGQFTKECIDDVEPKKVDKVKPVSLPSY